ncbi:hypothetical protein X975_22355, partial [Stegodyphus mimosarum]
MPRSKQRSSFDQVSEFHRGRTVAYRECGLAFWEIGSPVGRNQATIMRICDGWMQDGTTDRRVRSHPPQCTTSRDDRNIVRMAVTDHSVTSRTMAQHIQSITHYPVFCAYHSTPFTAEWSVRKTSVASSTLDAEPQTSPPPMVRRSTWEAECNEIVFTDEPRFCLQHHDGRMRVWRNRGERMQNSCVMHRHTGPSPGIMRCRLFFEQKCINSSLQYWNFRITMIPVARSMLNFLQHVPLNSIDPTPNLIAI